MKTSVDKLSDTRVKLNVTVPFDELGKEIDQAYKAIAQQVNIPGFRRGKAPRQLIDARFGRGPILEQVVNDMLPTRYEQALAENDLNPLGQPDIDVTKIEDNDVVEFTAEIDVRPEIEVPDFSQISVTVPELKVDDAAVDAELDTLRERFGELKDTKRKLKTDDYAIIDLEATINGEKLEDASTEGLTYRVGADDLIAKVQGGWVDFDAAVASPELMGKVGRLGKVLGPRNLMPNPKTGTVTPDVAKAVADIKGGKIDFRVDKHSNLHFIIGKTSFEAKALVENYAAALEEVLRLKPSSSKGRYISKATVATTFGPGVPMDPNVTSVDSSEL